MSKTWAVLAIVAVVAAGGIMTPSPAEAGDVGPGLAIGVLTTFPDDYDGYVYGPLPYGKLFAPGGFHGSRVYHGRRFRRGSHVHSVTRIHHMARAYRSFDPYYGGGPFYQHHYCCRYW